MLLVGLTGGIASGKTLVSDSFASLGVPVLDADQLAREVVVPGSKGLNTLISQFGSVILTPKGELDRAALRRIIFANPADREIVDRIMHPLIRERSSAAISALQQAGHAYGIYAIPLLVETGQKSRFDRILVVDVPVAVQLARLQARDNSDLEQAQAIIASQASREQRLHIADDVIVNDQSIEYLQQRVQQLHTFYTSLSSSS